MAVPKPNAVPMFPKQGPVNEASPTVCLLAALLPCSIVNPIRAGSTRSRLKMPRNFIPALVRGMVVGVVEHIGEAQPISP
jgi:hypothetical protein